MYPSEKFYIRRVIQVLMIEGIVLGFLYIVVPMRDIKTALAAAVSVVIVYHMTLLPEPDAKTQSQ